MNRRNINFRAGEEVILPNTVLSLPRELSRHYRKDYKNEWRVVNTSYSWNFEMNYIEHNLSLVEWKGFFYNYTGGYSSYAQQNR